MATIPTTALGALIREKRQSQGLSLDALGRLVGVHRTNIIKHEQGERFPKRVLPAYVEALAAQKSHGLAVEEEGVRFHGRKPPQFSFSMLVDGTRFE